MPLELTVEQRDLQDSLRASLARAGTGSDVWQSLLDMGLTEVPFPEEFGGTGDTFKDTTVVVSELGRSLGASPYLSSVVLGGLTLLHAASDSAQTAHLPAIVAGKARAALVSGFPFTTSSVTAVVDGETLILDGVQETVIDGSTADVLVVVAQTPDGPELAVVDANGTGIRRKSRETLDLTRKLASVEFTGVRAQRATGPDLAVRMARAQALAITALAAEQVGAARACLEMSVEYAQNRKQFGRAIGSFQSIKHRLADMLVAIELAEAAVLDAAGAEVRGDDELVVAAAIARVLASRAAMFAAEESIQVHGGIGFTWEHPLHNYFRRAKTSELIFGGPAVHAETVAAALVAPL